jgi:hypothetical protein
VRTASSVGGRLLVPVLFTCLQSRFELYPLFFAARACIFDEPVDCCPSSTAAITESIHLHNNTIYNVRPIELRPQVSSTVSPSSVWPALVSAAQNKVFSGFHAVPGSFSATASPPPGRSPRLFFALSSVRCHSPAALAFVFRSSEPRSAQRGHSWVKTRALPALKVCFQHRSIRAEVSLGLLPMLKPSLAWQTAVGVHSLS